jgi:hypothetical protein
VTSLGVRARADDIVERSRRLRPMRATDFSLLEIGEATSMRGTMRLLIGGLGRWRDRVQRGREGGRRAGARGLRDLALSLDANWRYAYTTFLVGRLVSRLPRE